MFKIEYWIKINIQKSIIAIKMTFNADWNNILFFKLDSNLT